MARRHVLRMSAQHWDGVYASKPAETVSWYQDSPATSLRLIRSVAPSPASLIDVGAGESRLVDELLADGWSDLTLLDVSEQALSVVRARLGDAPVELVVADLLAWTPARTYEVWHDRAVLHFLVAEEDRKRYAELAGAAVRPGGHVVVGTFALDGPDRCSGLPAARYDAAGLAELFAEGFELVASTRESHTTPGGAEQRFTWAVLRRRD